MDQDTKARFMAHIGKRIDGAFAAQPYRGTPSFDDIKAGILAALDAAEEGPPPEAVSEPEPAPAAPADPAAAGVDTPQPADPGPQ